MESWFIHSNLLLLGLPLLAVPIVIHLINLFRHRRVKWAAMEFLLQAHKRSRTWIILKQLLLLLMRVAAIAAVILILAQLLMREEWQRLIGGVATHHVVLIDDTFSTSDQGPQGSVLDRIRQEALRIGQQAEQAATPQKLTLLRFSRPTRPDLNVASVDQNFQSTLNSALERIAPSQRDTQPGRVLDLLDDVLPPPVDEKRIVYLLSDFRLRDWESTRELDERLARLNQQGVDVRLIVCADEERSNLSITALQPRPGALAAGVPLFMEVSVKNHGTTPRRDVSVLLQEDGRTRPSVVIDEILPGQTQTRRFMCHFPVAGEHRIQATLEKDPIEADNARHCVIHLPVGVPALICDGDPAGSDARFLSLALSPGEPVRTGINPRIEQPRYLIANPLDDYPVIYLTNFERLDLEAVKKLEEYVRSGGGLAIFVSETLSVGFSNEHLYKQGEGLMPVPLAAEFDLIVDRLEKAPDLDPLSGHDIFRIFDFQRDDFLEKVNVWKYFAVQKDWAPEPDSSTQVICRLRNGAPLAVEKRFGDGRVAVFLTTAAPVWNNWCRNPSFVVTVLELQNYLTGNRTAGRFRDVGEPIEETLDPAVYRPGFTLNLPNDQIRGQAQSADKLLTVQWDETEEAGIYELNLTTHENRNEVRSYAYNVNAEEGAVALMSLEKLQTQITAPRTQIVKAGTTTSGSGESSRSSVSEFLLYALILLLLGEQVLAYFASYHPPARAAVAA